MNTERYYKDRYNEYLSTIEKNIYDFDFIYEMYKENVRPYESVITNYLIEQRLKGNTLKKKFVSKALGVSYAMFQIMIKVFDLDEIFTTTQSVMGLKAQMDLQKALNLKPSSARLVELGMVRYDDEYKKKDEDTQMQPPKLVFEVIDARISEEELKEKAPKIE